MSTLTHLPLWTPADSLPEAPTFTVQIHYKATATGLERTPHTLSRNFKSVSQLGAFLRTYIIHRCTNPGGPQYVKFILVIFKFKRDLKKFVSGPLSDLTDLMIFLPADHQFPLYFINTSSYPSIRHSPRFVTHSVKSFDQTLFHNQTDHNGESNLYFNPVFPFLM